MLIITFLPQKWAEDDYSAQNTKFKEVWNSGGSMSLAAQGIDPNRAEEELRRQAFLRQHVENSFFYQIRLVPKWASALSFPFAWVFQPGWFSLILSVWVLLYAGLWFEKSWNKIYPVLLVVGVSVSATFAYYLLYGAIGGNHNELAFGGISAGTALAAGALSRLHGAMIPIWLPFKTKYELELHPWLFGLLWFIADFIIHLQINSVNYAWGFVIDVVIFGVGVYMAPRLGIVPTRRRR